MSNTNIETMGYSRVMNALKGYANDQCPFGMLLSLYGKNYVDCTLKDYYSNPNLYLKGQKEVVNKFNPDIVTIPFVLAFEGEYYGSTLKHFDNYPPQIKRPIINSYKEIAQIKTPTKLSKSKEYLLNCAELLAAEYKKDKLIAGIAISNIDSPALIMGIESWIDTLLFHEYEAQELIKKISDDFVRYANNLFAKGIDVLVVSNMFSNPQIVTSKILNTVTLQYLTDAFKKIEGPIIIHHGGARLGKFLDLFNDVPNVIGFAIDARDDLNASREKIDTKLLLGNLDTHIISKRTPELIANKTNNILLDRKKDANFIFFNANGDILLETPEENILAIISAIKNFKANAVKAHQYHT